MKECIKSPFFDFKEGYDEKESFGQKPIDANSVISIQDRAIIAAFLIPLVRNTENDWMAHALIFGSGIF